MPLMLRLGLLALTRSRPSAPAISLPVSTVTSGPTLRLSTRSRMISRSASRLRRTSPVLSMRFAAWSMAQRELRTLTITGPSSSAVSILTTEGG
jgi:hypothetical protein